MRRAPTLLAMLCVGAAHAATPPPVHGTWHVSHGMVAPWVAEDAERPDVTALLGKTLVFHPDRVEGPGVLACANARYERDARPLAGLFQGNLPDPPENGAGSVGLGRPPVDSVSLTCDSGIFDLHFASADALLLGLDNVVWVLDRSPGARAAAGTPEQAAQALLEDHYAHGLEFTAERTLAQRARFSAALAAKMQTYFALEVPEGDAPPINGDPFTDSQEYPPVFSVREAKIDGERAVVPVRYDTAYDAPRRVELHLVREAGTWVLDDIHYEHDMTFSQLLALTE